MRINMLPGLLKSSYPSSNSSYYICVSSIFGSLAVIALRLACRLGTNKYMSPIIISFDSLNADSTRVFPPSSLHPRRAPIYLLLVSSYEVFTGVFGTCLWGSTGVDRGTEKTNVIKQTLGTRGPAMLDSIEGLSPLFFRLGVCNRIVRRYAVSKQHWL